MDTISTQLLQQGKDKHIFVLFSNEDLNIQHSSNVFISNEEWYVDHHIMTVCDYLIGPPSTFTLWAGYIGHAKVIHIHTDKGNVIL